MKLNEAQSLPSLKGRKLVRGKTNPLHVHPLLLPPEREGHVSCLPFEGDKSDLKECTESLSFDIRICFGFRYSHFESM
jgi:hypothetical protein